MARAQASEPVSGYSAATRRLTSDSEAFEPSTVLSLMRKPMRRGGSQGTSVPICAGRMTVGIWRLNGTMGDASGISLVLG
jgi:hypothetical protein